MSKLINRIVVSTDSGEYASIAKNYGAEVPFLRPAEISRDQSSDLEFIRHALEFLGEEDSYLPDYIIHIRPTTPIRIAENIDLAIEVFSACTDNYTSLRSVHEMSESVYKSFEIEDGQLVSAFFKERDLEASNQPRQSMPKTYSPNGYVDIILPSFVSSHRKIHGDKVFPFLTEQVIEVDTIWDLQMLEMQIQQEPELEIRLFGGK
jgi:N-acylneuraminate cytidylyltransferase